MLKAVLDRKWRIGTDVIVGIASVILGIWLFTPRSEAACDGITICGFKKCPTFTDCIQASECGSSCCQTSGKCCYVQLFLCTFNNCVCGSPSCVFGSSVTDQGCDLPNPSFIGPFCYIWP
jgi:hypothetical protein